MNCDLKSKVRSKFSQAELGRRMDLPQQVISRWVNGQQQVPSGRIIPLCTLLGWEITPHELRPDLHPTPASGIPDGVILPSRQSARE
ncbi:transcriptional regulator [Serratia fonticola]|uniref:transcriptional regulator n=1 Tax=Serratia fonticola TaxID=47917 RepID=UPI003AAB9CE8|nr:helix-turn-helix domain-containing protein [Serratia fonticola]HBE9088485.1 helix-turn-helix domain-containing protein [Serratia fonticola]